MRLPPKTRPSAPTSSIPLALLLACALPASAATPTTPLPLAALPAGTIVTLAKDTRVNLRFGATTIPRGTKLALVSVARGQVQARFGSDVVTVGATDVIIPTIVPAAKPIAMATPVPSPKSTPMPTTAPAASAFGPWQPLFTEVEWKEPKPGRREIVDGRVHMKGPATTKPQPAADGAIRARIQYQKDSSSVGFHARRSAETGLYKAELSADGATVSLRYFPASSIGGGPTESLGKFTLPRPLSFGDTLLLELRLEGDQLTVLADETVAIEARDSRAPGPGEWGIIAEDGWFESVEVQTPPAQK